MDTMIKEINGSLKEIIDNLAEVKDGAASILAEVEFKIGEKMDEAKLYKGEVEDNKKKIKGLEDEIGDLENDLADLNERFGKKDLNVIIETGNREINTKISEKQGLITKHRQKIGELTEKGRSIKELLNSLRKDKKTKEERLQLLSKIFNYYNEQISHIIEFAAENPSSLDAYAPTIRPYKGEDPEEVLEGVFDEIIDIADTDDSTEATPSLDLDYIAGSKEELDLDDIFEKLKKKKEVVEEPTEIDEELGDAFATADLNVELEPVTVLAEDNSEEIKQFLETNGLSIDKINDSDLNSLKINFDVDKAQKVINVLKDNKINLEAIYNGISILNHSDAEELNKVITKLLLTDQTTSNIALVLGKLSDVKVNDLNDVVKNLGVGIKTANIVELVLSSVKEPLTININYVTELGFTTDEVNSMTTSLTQQVLEAMSAFPELVKINFNNLNKYNIANIKDVFSGYAHMFLQNPDRFEAILDKYDPADLVRCVEKNAAVIEKL